LLKPKDYELAEELECANPYAAWKRALSDGRPLRPGDVLERIQENTGEETQQLWINKYVGFEPAQWSVPELKPAASPSTAQAEVLSS
jgi:hypothetical protein